MVTTGLRGASSHVETPTPAVTPQFKAQVVLEILSGLNVPLAVIHVTLGLKWVEEKVPRRGKTAGEAPRPRTICPTTTTSTTRPAFRLPQRGLYQVVQLPVESAGDRGNPV